MVTFNDALASRGTIEIYVSYKFGDKMVGRIQDEGDAWLKVKLEELKNEAELRWPQAKVEAMIDQ